MKKICKHFIPLLLVFLMLPVTAYAAGSIDTDRDVKLTVSYRDGSTPLAGAEFSIYLVATVDEYGELTTTDTFKQFNVDIRGKNDDAWKALASTLEGYVLRDAVAPTDSGRTDKDGYLYFPTGGQKLPQGLYLVLGQRHSQNGYRYDATPFMVMLPTQNTVKNQWDYDVIVSPKFDKSEIPDRPSTVTRKVLKVWEDNGYTEQRPKEIVVQLLRDGKVYDTVTMNADNDWRYTWSNLDDSYRWTVVEKECKGYTVEVSREGVTFVVTNTYIPETPPPTEPSEPTEPPTPTTPPDKPNLPQTGQLWWPVPMLFFAGLMFVVVGLIRRRRSDDEA